MNSNLFMFMSSSLQTLEPVPIWLLEVGPSGSTFGASTRTVFGSAVTMNLVEAELLKVGREAYKKGAPWYFQQFLKIEAVAIGVGGLSNRVRIIDGDVLVLRRTHWFFQPDGVIHDICFSKTDGLNSIRYGNVYFNLTGRRLIGGPEMVAHSMSVTRKHAKILKSDLGQGDSGDNSSESSWVFRSLRALCDPNAFTGFSEYWYLLSSAVFHFPSEVAFRLQNPESPPYCARVDSGLRSCPMNAADIIKKTRSSDPNALHVVFEAHDSTRVRGFGRD